ncbi:MAG: hypothetical protein V4726_13765 [Verrucomicrobiota bacterium]
MFRAPLLLCAAAAVAGTGLGWLGRAARDGGPHETSAPPAATAVEKTAAAKPAAGKRLLTPAEQKAEALALRLSADKGVKYWLRLLGAAETAPSALLARLADSLEKEPAALRLLGTRWAQEDAGGMFAALKARAAKDPPWFASRRPGPGFAELQKILVGEWFRQNPEALMAALGGTIKVFRLKPAMDQFLTLLAAANPEQALRLSLTWKTPLPVKDTAALISWARANARQAAEMLLATDGLYLTRDDARSLVMSEAAKVLAETDPANTLARFTDLRNSSQQRLVVSIAKEWARRDLAAAAAWFSDGHVNPVNTVEQITPLLEVWGTADPAAAMAWADSHLTGSPRDHAAGTIVEAIAARNTAKAVEFVSQLPPGHAQSEAMRKLTNFSVKKKEKPELLAAFQWMMAMPDPVMRTIAMDSGAPEITKAAPEEVMAYLNSPAGASAPLSLLTNAASVMSQSDGPAAMEWTSSLRPDVAGKVRRIALGSWLSRDSDAAGSWVRGSPPGDGRAMDVKAITEMIGREKGEEAVNVWLDTLPASDHAAVRQGLENSWSMDPAAKARLEAKYR